MGAGDGRAFGKVILLGEHVVVYGVPALAVGIDRGAQARAESASQGPSRLRITGPGFEGEVREDDASKDLGRAFRALLEVARSRGAVEGARDVTARADLPAGAGLGCSAALGVAIARALEPGAGNADIRKSASAWEQVFHGKPSGIDAAVATEGGCLLFERLAQGEKLTPLVVAPGGLRLVVGHSGVASSTKTMVDAVARLRDRRPEVVEKIFDGVRSLVTNARLALEQGDVAALGKLMDMNQMLLGGLMVSTPDIEKMCASARAAGAAGAKLTGAGGGGCVIALVTSEAAGEAVAAAWKADGFDAFVTVVEGTVPAVAGAHVAS